MLMRSPLARDRRRPEGFVQPCQPTLAREVPTGPGWIHELKYDGFRIIVRKSGDAVRIWSRYGRSRKSDFEAVVAAIKTCISCRSRYGRARSSDEFRSCF